MPQVISSSRAVHRVFREDALTLGLVLPLRTGERLDYTEQIALAELADALGFAAVWVRDVPLNGPWYPETIGHLDPWVALGAIAARTRSIALGTAAAVLPLRHPLHVAKAALSLQVLSQGRTLLGLGSGDRPEEYAAFGRSFEDRKAIQRDNWERMAEALRSPDDIRIGSERYEMRPTSAVPPPLVAIGGGGQTLEWVARHAAGWATYHREPHIQRDRHALWRRAVERAASGEFRSFSVALRIEFDETVKEPVSLPLGYRTGMEGLRAIVAEQEDLGVHHLMMNLEIVRGSPFDALKRIAGLTRTSSP